MTFACRDGSPEAAAARERRTTPYWKEIVVLLLTCVIWPAGPVQ